MYCSVKNIIDFSMVKKVLGKNFEKFVSKYGEDIAQLAVFYENGGFESGHFMDNDEEAEKYFQEFVKDFKELKKKFLEKTGAVLEIAYAESVCGDIKGYYFYVPNAFVPNPNIDSEIMEHINPTAIAEDFDD